MALYFPRQVWYNDFIEIKGEEASMTTLIVVRHGQSVSNLQKRFTGQHETDLTELGHLQAENTARFLDDCHIDKIYASDLSRAMETARHTAERKGLLIPTVDFARSTQGFGRAWSTMPSEQNISRITKFGSPISVVRIQRAARV